MSDAWPAWATQKVEIVASDPRWRHEAAELARDVDRLLAPWRDGATEHVGSTAVPGLPAKPVIDLLTPVGTLDGAAGAEEVLAEAGWHQVPPELDERPWRRLYVLPDGDRRRAHLHLVERSHPKWRETIVFRDRLRARPDLASDYAQLKRSAAEAHRDDREGYTSAKSAFVERVLAEGDGPADTL